MPEKYLICLMLAIASLSSHAQSSSPECRAFDIQIEITNTSSSLPNGSLKIQSQETFEPVLHLVSRDAKKSRYNVKSLQVSSLAPGQYELIITDFKDRFCPKHQKITIQ